MRSDLTVTHAPTWAEITRNDEQVAATVIAPPRHGRISSYSRCPFGAVRFGQVGDRIKKRKSQFE